MTIHLPHELKQFVHDQVVAGHYRSEDDVIRDALEQLRAHLRAPRPASAPSGRCMTTPTCSNRSPGTSWKTAGHGP